MHTLKHVPGRKTDVKDRVSEQGTEGFFAVHYDWKPIRRRLGTFGDISSRIAWNTTAN